MTTLAEPPYIILGCGYTGTRLTQALRADGVPVRVCARRVALLEPLRALGADVHYLDAGKPRYFPVVLHGANYKGAAVVYSVPGTPDLPPGEAVRRAGEAAQKNGASAFVYLGTSGVYGRNELPQNDEWIDEDSPISASDPDMAGRLADEAALESLARGGLRTVNLRLSAIYGPALGPGHPARGVRQRLRRGEYKLVNGGRYYFSRIHVDDLVAIIRAAVLRAPAGSLYVVGDDHPCPAAEYGRWLAQHLGLPEPKDAEPSSVSRMMQRGRRLRNDRLKRDLGVTLRYPSYREGEAQIDSTDGTEGTGADGATSAAAHTTAAPAVSQTPQVPQAPVRVLQPGMDLGEALGGAASGARLVRLELGEAAPAGPPYLVLSPGAQRVGDGAALPPLAACPAGVAVRAAAGPVLLLALA